MIDLEFLQSLIRSLDESGLDHVEVERGGTKVRLSKSPPAQPATVMASGGMAPSVAETTGEPSRPSGVESSSDSAPASADGGEVAPGTVDVTSPMVGTFYRSPAPDAPSYVDVGSTVGIGDTLCIIEAMKLMNELEAEVSGKVVEICVENADPVEYGQVLFRVDAT